MSRIASGLCFDMDSSAKPSSDASPQCDVRNVILSFAHATLLLDDAGTGQLEHDAKGCDARGRAEPPHSNAMRPTLVAGATCGDQSRPSDTESPRAGVIDRWRERLAARCCVSN
jgi:hypothetical protein